MKKFLFLLTGLMFMLASCGGGEDENSEPTPAPKPNEPAASITMNTNIPSGGLAFDVNGGEKSVSFTTNKDWTVTVAATTGGTTWCTASPASGSQGDATVKFSVKENTDYDDRSVSVTIKAGTATKTFTINQKGADALLITTKKYEVAQEGGEIEVEVQANIDYEMEISETAKSWITEATTRALTTHKHTFMIAANEEVEKREGEIVFKSGDKVETVKVYQAGGPVLVLSKNEFNVSDAGETITIEVKSNIDFGVQMPDVDWIVDEAATRGMSSHTLKYDILPNEAYDAREAEIVFYDKNGDLKETVKIVQAQKDAIIISNKNYEVNSEGETIEVKLSANVEFDVTMPDVDWITQVTTRGLTEHTLYYKVAENTSEDSRSAEIVFTNKESQLSEKIVVTQQKKSVLSLDKNEYSASAAGETISIQVKSNVAYEIQMPDVDWITKETSTRAASTETVKFVIAPNETYDGREAEILFKDKNSNLSTTLKITQAQKDAIILSKKEINVEAEGKTIEVKLSANVEFEVQMPDVDWITQVTTRGLTEHTLYFEVAENVGEESRSAEIVFTDKKSQLNEKITVIQDAPASYVDGVATLTKAGALKELLGDDYLNITSLKVIGPLNGTDIRLIREMAGRDLYGEKTNGSLVDLDISKATIVEGGGEYIIYYHKFDANLYERYVFTSPNVIGIRMFSYLDNLREIILPDNVTDIDYMAFYDCDALTSITIPNSVTSIGESAFYDCDALTSIIIPNSVTSIVSRAFYDCDALTSIIIPDNVTYMGEYAFEGCSSLTSATIGSSIYTGAFKGCESLKSITIGKGVTSIEYGAFEDCKTIESVYISDLSAWCKIDFKGNFKSFERPNSNPLHCGAKLYLNDNEVTDLVIPNDISEIKEYTFYSCNSLTSVTIPDCVKSIGERAFAFCDALSSVKIGNSVTSMGERIFANCKSLASVTIDTDIIGKWAFYDCVALAEVTIGNGVTSIEDYAFCGCDALKTITIPNNVTSIGNWAFASCSSLTSATIGNGIIKEKAFYGCSSLVSVTLGEGVNWIWCYAFDKCSSLIECYCYATKPPTLQCSDVMGTKWDNFPPKKKNSTLYVPAGCGSVYKGKYNGHWKDFFTNIIEMEE